MTSLPSASLSFHAWPLVRHTGGITVTDQPPGVLVVHVPTGIEPRDNALLIGAVKT